jgi:membrane-associated phospholipid phosphatase
METNVLRSNYLFIITAAVFAALLFGLHALLPKGYENIVLNSERFAMFDNIVITVTHMGLGSVLLFVSVFLGLKRAKYFLFAVLAIALAGLLTYALKQFVFYGEPRPFCFLAGYDLRLIPDYKYHCSNTFPSGHTMAAFAFSTVAAAASKLKSAQLFFALFAATVGFSRMYLLQHFSIDVCAGAVLGTICGLAPIMLLSGFGASKLNMPIFKLFRFPKIKAQGLGAA